MERKDDLQYILNHYGIKAQKLMLIEEMSELTKELCKSERGKTDIDHICEEIADVQIMLNQIKLQVGNEPLISKYYHEKIDRQLIRMKKEEN